MDEYEIAEKEQEREESRLSTLADLICDRDGVGLVDKSRDGYGLCGKCKYFSYQRSVLNDEYVWCRDSDDHARKIPLRPNKVNPIVDCSFFYPVGLMNMWEMNRIAWRIDIEDEEGLGFGGMKNRVVKITRP